MKLILVFLFFGTVNAAGLALECKICKLIRDKVIDCKDAEEKCKRLGDSCTALTEIDIPVPTRPISCHTCKKTENGVENCVGAVQQCENPDDVCATQIENNKLGDDNQQTVKKGCIPLQQAVVCLQQMVLNTTDKFQFLLYSKCCDTDGCNKEGIKMPPGNQVPNGLVCPSCFVEDSLVCPETVNLPCNGTQFQCYDFSGKATRPGQKEKPYAFQGCATVGACCVDPQTLPGSGVDKDAKYTCTAALPRIIT